MRACTFSLLMLIQAPCLPVLGQTVTGSGFVIHPEGYVLTNHHVVAGADQVSVVVPGKGALPASIVADDEYKDLALLKIGATGLESLPIAESKNVKILDTIVVLGYPLAPALGADVSASEGQVNAFREEGRIPLFQIDANVNPGNSGGPVLNDRGEVIGVVVAKLNAALLFQETGSIPERVNFAIPIDEARGMVRKAYPLAFTPSANTERLTAQEVFDQGRKAAVLIIAKSSTRTMQPPAESSGRIFRGSADFVLSVNKALDEHDWAKITRYTVDGETNYFGHGKVTNAFIRRDMEGDLKTYRWTRSKPAPATFKTWTATGLTYDSIELQTEALEVSGKYHHAHCLFIIGYDPGRSYSIYSLEWKVIK